MQPNDTRRDEQMLYLGGRIAQSQRAAGHARDLRAQFGRAICDTIERDALRDAWRDLGGSANRAADIADGVAAAADNAADGIAADLRDAAALACEPAARGVMHECDNPQAMRDLAGRARAAAHNLREAERMPNGWTRCAPILAAMGITSEEAAERDLLDWVHDPAPDSAAEDAARGRSEARAWILRAASAYAAEEAGNMYP